MILVRLRFPDIHDKITNEYISKQKRGKPAEMQGHKATSLSGFSGLGSIGYIEDIRWLSCR